MPLPKPSEYDNETTFMSACISAQDGEDLSMDQKVAICYGTWEGKAESESEGEMESESGLKPQETKTAHTTGYQSEKSATTFIMSNASVDRMGDTIDPMGWDLNNFKKNPIALFNHNYDLIIGKWNNIRVEGNNLMGDLELAEAGTSELVDTVRSLVEQRILSAVSVGFAATEYDFGESGIDFKKQELMECSLVSVPANPQALAVARSFGCDFKKIFTPDSILEVEKDGETPVEKQSFPLRNKLKLFHFQRKIK
jgi:HK97 family phage prohead protease